MASSCLTFQRSALVRVSAPRSRTLVVASANKPKAQVIAERFGPVMLATLLTIAPPVVGNDSTMNPLSRLVPGVVDPGPEERSYPDGVAQRVSELRTSWNTAQDKANAPALNDLAAENKPEPYPGQGQNTMPGEKPLEDMTRENEKNLFQRANSLRQQSEVNPLSANGV